MNIVSELTVLKTKNSCIEKFHIPRFRQSLLSIEFYVYFVELGLSSLQETFNYFCRCSCCVS